jgi:dephospho-CoA kinase
VRVIGLTGGIGSGKSTVGRLLAACGAHVVDADLVARFVVEPGQPALAEIETRFGRGVIKETGELDRQGLATIVFADPGALADLEAITHPRIAQEIDRRIRSLAQQMGDRDELVVLEHPLLVEAGLAVGQEVVVVVQAPKDVRVSRLVKRGLTASDAMARMAAQADDQTRRDAATHVVDNGGSQALLLREVADLMDALEVLRGSS